MLALISLVSLTTLLPPIGPGPGPGPGPTDSLIIFNANRTYHYHAVFISPIQPVTNRLFTKLQIQAGRPFRPGPAAIRVARPEMGVK